MSRYAASEHLGTRSKLKVMGAVLFWVGAAALGGTFVLGCGGGGGDSEPTPDPDPGVVVSGPTMAISGGGQIKLYTGISDLANSGSAPVPAQTINAPNVQSVAFDFSGNLYYLANDGSSGSDAAFYFCERPNTGLPFPACTTVGGPIAGGQWLAIDTTGTVFATSLAGGAGTVVSFPAASGPLSTPAVVYTSTTVPAAYGGIAVDSSDTLYVTEQSTAGTLHGTLFACTTVCQGSTGSQVDLTSNITASSPSSPPGGPLAMGSDGMTVFVGVSNTDPVALTAPIAFECAPDGSGGLTCQALTTTFPPLAGADSPFVTTVGIAASPENDVYDAVLLTDGNTTDDTGPAFFGFDSAGAPFACSSSPSSCRVSQLPSVPVNSAAGSVAYGLAVSPVP
jgi:hypothetical protein